MSPRMPDLAALAVRPLLLAAALAPLTAAETLEVPQDYDTISQAAQAAEPGDEVLIKGGVYEATVMKGVTGVTLRAKGKVVFRAPQTEAASQGLTMVACSDMTLEGLRFEDLDEALRVFDSRRVVLRDLRFDRCDEAVFFDDVDFALLEGLRIKDGGSRGVYTDGGGDVTVRDCRMDLEGTGINTLNTPRFLASGNRIVGGVGIFVGAGSDSDVVDNDLRATGRGLVLFGPRTTARDNRIHDCEVGIQTGLGPTQIGAKIIGNRIWNCSDAGIWSWNLNALVTDNVISNVGDVGLQVRAEGQRVSGNVIRKTGGPGVQILDSAGGNTFIGNRIQKTGGPALLDEVGDNWFLQNVPAEVND